MLQLLKDLERACEGLAHGKGCYKVIFITRTIINYKFQPKQKRYGTIND